jgi:hypothetical protein
MIIKAATLRLLFARAQNLYTVQSWRHFKKIRAQYHQRAHTDLTV